MRLIDADAYAYPGDLIDEPTVEPVFVVRCKDCKHWGYGVPEDGEESRACVENAHVEMPCDGFCHKGERRMNR